MAQMVRTPTIAAIPMPRRILLATMATDYIILADITVMGTGMGIVTVSMLAREQGKL
jgi:hypothetical protein